MRNPGRLHPHTIILIVTCVAGSVLGGLCLFTAPTIFFGLGHGSPRSAEKWKERFASIPNPEAAAESYPQVAGKRFKNGEWIFGVAEDSHESSRGGTMVLKDSTGHTRVFFGHVCGPWFLHSMLKKPESLEEFYRSEAFTTFNFQEYTGP